MSKKPSTNHKQPIINIHVSGYQDSNEEGEVDETESNEKSGEPDNEIPKVKDKNEVKTETASRPSLRNRVLGNRKETGLKIVELSDELLQKVSSRNVHQWKPRDAEIWLEHIFDGSAKDLIAK
jgi:hypothetical protein